MNAFEIGTSGRFNFFDSRRFPNQTEPSYVLQLLHPSTPTNIGESFTFRAVIVALEPTAAPDQRP